MKIAYVLGGLWRHHPGLQSKILGAAQVWEKAGHDVSLVLYSEGKVIDADGKTNSISNQEIVNKLEAYYNTNLNKLARLFMLRHQYAFLQDTLASLQPDMVYARYAFPFFGLRRTFGSVCPYIIEINSDDLTEYGLKNSVTGIYNRLFRKNLLKGAAGLSFISKELSECRSFNWYKGKSVVVSNSISCDDFPFNLDTKNNIPNICFIGSPNQSWHGLDKLNVLIERYPQWLFHIVGPNKKESLSAGLKGYKNTVFHGYLMGDEAQSLMLTMDAGISTLALHRKKMHEASPLKSRQYLAQGIPFISAYDDTGIPSNDCVLQLPNTESNVVDNVEKIGSFVNNAFLNSALRKQARLFAENFLDSNILEKKRLEFIESCL